MTGGFCFHENNTAAIELPMQCAIRDAACVVDSSYLGAMT